MTTVTIAKSDYPNGMFGFRGPLEIIRENPARQEQTTLTIERSGGHQGQQTVSLKVFFSVCSLFDSEHDWFDFPTLKFVIFINLADVRI